MEKDPQREIMVDPKWSILMDGNGYNVMSTGGLPGVDRDGTEIITLMIKPDDIVRKRYNLRGEQEVNQQGNTKLIVRKIDLIPMNLYDDANRKWLYVKDFNHNDTDLSLREKNLKEIIQQLKKKVIINRGGKYKIT